MLDKLTGKEATGLVGSFEGVFKGLPHLPKGVIDFLVSIAPWLAGLGGLLSLFSGISSVFMTSRRNEFWAYVDRYAGVNSAYFTVIGVVAILLGLLYLMAFTPLKNKKLSGWMYLFWGQLLSILSGVAGLVFGYGGIVGTLIGAAIGFYVLFEVKASYK